MTNPDENSSVRPRTLIAGAAQGMGRAVAQLLAENGHSLVLADLQEGLVADVAKTLRANGADVECSGLDLNDYAQVETVVDAAGPITGVVSTAALMHSADPLTVSPHDFERLLKLNLVGNYVLLQAAARSMIEGGRAGSAVVVTSAAARRPHPNLEVYAASKAGLTQALRILGLATQAHNIRINTVAPTATRTEMLTNDASKGSGVTPAYVNEPVDIAGVIAFLLSPASRAINLREIPLDGGTLLGL